MNEPWTKRELALLGTLSTPELVQRYVDATPYSTDEFYRSPRRVMKDRRAHCADGATFAAAALRRLGHRPRIVWLTAENDDGHMLAVYRRRGLWGAVAKSNFVGLRWREPVYRTVRELAMSYFQDYFNDLGERTLRGYTRPMSLAGHDRLGWMTEEKGLERLLDVELERMRVRPLVPRGAMRWMTKVDARTKKAGMMGVDRRGLYKVGG